MIERNLSRPVRIRVLAVPSGIDSSSLISAAVRAYREANTTARRCSTGSSRRARRIWGRSDLVETVSSKSRTNADRPVTDFSSRIFSSASLRKYGFQARFSRRKWR